MFTFRLLKVRAPLSFPWALIRPYKHPITPLGNIMVKIFNLGI
jgi:hypothetical protein